MAFKKTPTAPPVPNSPDNLFRDLPRRTYPSLYDHQGQMLRAYIAEALKATDVAFELPTGSGKTLVGLLLAEWRRRKYDERVVYLCPTRQLVNQVANEANNKYGLTVESFIGPIKSYSPRAKTTYNDAAKVAITTYSSLFNSNPFFNNPDIVILDDVHAAENYIAKQWSFSVIKEDNNILFNAIASVLRPSIDSASYTRLVSGPSTYADLGWIDSLPLPELHNIKDDLISAINSNIAQDPLRHNWNLLSDHISACQLYFSCNEILIRPLVPPTWTHPPFETATQRIFMSATLGQGGDLERLTGRTHITRLPAPEGWDNQGIGRRFFIFPERSLDEDNTRKLSLQLMQKAKRSLIITQTNQQANDLAKLIEKAINFPIIRTTDLETDKDRFVELTEAIAIVANRYDGIDLPNEECRMLFVDGLQRSTNLQEKFLVARMGAALLFNERTQTRALQAVGRCTRGLNDYAVIVVTGEELSNYLTDMTRRRNFHPELQAELEFGIEQSTEITANDILDNVDIFLRHDAEWEEVDKQIIEKRENVNRELAEGLDDLSSSVRHEIKWQMAIWRKDYLTAYDEAREVIGKLNNSKLRGYRALWHYLAGASADLATLNEIQNLTSSAAEQYRNAGNAAVELSWIIKLAHRHRKDDEVNKNTGNTLLMIQIENLEIYLEKLGTTSNRKFSEREAEIRRGLSQATTFEHAQVLLGQHLGFLSSKIESDASPDPWWRIEDIVIVFEDHAGASSDNAVIDAHKARQTITHPNWIRENVENLDKNTKIYPVLISPAKRANEGAVPNLHDIYYWNLDEFRQWAETALSVIRELRSSFRERGDLPWKADAAVRLENTRISITVLERWLKTQVAAKKLLH